MNLYRFDFYPSGVFYVVASSLEVAAAAARERSTEKDLGRFTAISIEYDVTIITDTGT